MNDQIKKLIAMIVELEADEEFIAWVALGLEFISNDEKIIRHVGPFEETDEELDASPRLMAMIHALVEKVDEVLVNVRGSANWCNLQEMKKAGYDYELPEEDIATLQLKTVELYFDCMPG